MALFIFLFWLMVLIAEGTLLTAVILRKKISNALPVAFGLPMGSLINVLLVFFYTVAQVPLTFWSMCTGHAVIIAILLFLFRRTAVHTTDIFSEVHSQIPRTIFLAVIRGICLLVLGFQFIFSFTHAVILPTYHMDSLTNWTMRSKVSFEDRAMAFDATEVRGVAKPQYPFLFHALQITVNEGNAEWNDRSANSVHFLLSLSSLLALFLLMARRKGNDIALLCITLITSIPLFAFHLSQGYGDLPLILFLCVSMTALWLWRNEDNAGWLMLSALCMAAGVWTKSEGLVVGFLPWVLLVFLLRRTSFLQTCMSPTTITGVLLSLLFPLFLLSRGMGLTPHATDTRLEWHPEVLGNMFAGIFSSGSMGMTWYVILFCSLVALWLWKKNDDRIQKIVMPLGLWALLSLVLVLGTYLFTPNAAFLENGESYYRQLMIPAALFIVWIIAVFEPRRHS